MDEVRSLVINTVLPDGEKKERKVIIAFEKDGKKYLVFATDRLENGNKVVGISYLKDGMYQSIEDMNDWNEVKTNLVSVLHDELKSYYIPEAEVTAAPNLEHFLALREANYEKLESNYKAYLSSASANTSSEPVSPQVLEPAPVEEVAPALQDTIPVSEPVNSNPEPVQDVVEPAPMDPASVQPSVPSEPVVDVTTPVMEPTPALEPTPTEPVMPVAPEEPVAPVVDIVPPVVEPVSSVEPSIEPVSIEPVSVEPTPTVDIEPTPVVEDINHLVSNEPIENESAASVLDQAIPIMDISNNEVEKNTYESELIALVQKFQEDFASLKEKYGK